MISPACKCYRIEWKRVIKKCFRNSIRETNHMEHIKSHTFSLTIYKLSRTNCDNYKKCSRWEVERPKTIHNRLDCEIFFEFLANQSFVNLIPSIWPACSFHSLKSNFFAQIHFSANQNGQKSIWKLGILSYYWSHTRNDGVNADLPFRRAILAHWAVFVRLFDIGLADLKL